MDEPFDVDAVPLDALEQIDQICLEFERGWRAGESPSLESALAGLPDACYLAALYFLASLEKELRCEKGIAPSLQEYVDRFPGQRQVLEQAWSKPVAFEVSLEVIVGPHCGQRFAFHQHDSFIVGRAECAHFQLPLKDPFFSRVHFLVEANPPNCRLVDLCSLNGTKVNGQQVDWTDLQEGDLIQGGDTVMRVAIRMTEGEPELTMDCPRMSIDETKVRETPPHIPGYELSKELGRGGMGVVYQARRVADDAPVALKVIRTAFMPSDHEVRRFLREAQILCALQHPNIVSFHQFGRADDRFYIVMDYVAGRDAAQLLEQDDPIAIPRAVRIVCQALEALQYAHENGYVHRDVKPSNLLIRGSDPTETCHLADFGLARAYFATRMSGLTLMGDIGGTLPFMAPEQITDFHNAQPAADQYGMAATLYYLLTRHYVYADEPSSDGRHIAKNILLGEPVPIEQRRVEVSTTLSRIIHRALARNPEDRFSRVAEFRAALSPWERPE